MNRSPYLDRRPVGRTLVFASLLHLAFLAPRPLVAAPPFTEVELHRFEGDYTVSVYPKPFGFLVQDGKLYLKVGGVASEGWAVPLLAKEDGKFVLSEGHPNAFQFSLEGETVRFTFWSGDQASPGARAGFSSTAAAPAAHPDAVAAPSVVSPPPATAAKSERTRTEVLAELAEAETALQSAPADPAARLRVAKLLFESGEFWRARDLALPLAEAATASAESLELAARLAYLTGDFDAAERLYDRLIAARAGDLGKRVMAKVGKMFVYLQRNRFDAVKSLGFPSGAVLPNATLAAAFEQNPYRLEWQDEKKVAEVPFLSTDPLPTFTIEVNGVPIQVLFDTGADLLILDDEVAKAMGIAKVASATGSFGGGLPASVGFGKVDRVKVGEVTIHEVPVAILATKRFSFEPKKHILGGIFGTALMRQFLGTLDYKNGRLVLRERSPEAARALRAELAGRMAAEIPFVLDATHLLMARGGVDGKEGLTLFVDSGLASEAAFVAPIQTLKYLGIAVPETKIPEDSVGGGGGKFPVGLFPVQTLSLGPLRQSNLKGEYGALPPQSYLARGFLQDGLLSHRFLRRYSSWTLDFDSRTFLFER